MQSNRDDRGGRGLRSTTAAVGLPVLGFIAVVAIWWAAVAFFHVGAYLVPSPPEVLAAFREQRTLLLQATGQTVEETILGYLLAVGIGFVSGALLASSRTVERILYPLLLVSNAIPKVIIAPLLVVWFGFYTEPKVFMVALICFFPIVLSTATGLMSTPDEMTELARSMTANRLQYLGKIQLRWALPQVFVGLKTAMFLATIGALVGEFAGGSQGIGYLISSYAGGGRTDLMTAGAVLISIAAIILYYLVVIIERLAVPWARAKQS